MEPLNSQPDQSRLETVLQEYPLLSLRPINVLLQDVDLNLLAIWNGVEAVEERSNYMSHEFRPCPGRAKRDVLSLAVFAFAVEETNERDRVMTSATPLALLKRKGKYFLLRRVSHTRARTSGPDRALQA